MRFSVFSPRENVATCYDWERWPQRKGVCLALRPRKNYALFVNSTGFLLPLCLFFFCAFCCSTCFVSCKSSVAFFVCCYSLPFWLCLFVRVGAFPAPNYADVFGLTASKHYSLNLAFPPLFFLFVLFFSATKVFSCSCSFVVGFLVGFSRSCYPLFFYFLFCLFCPFSSKIHCFGIAYFCCTVNVVFVVFLVLLWVLLFSLCVPP